MGLLSEDEEEAAAQNARRQPSKSKRIESSISNKVAGGNIVQRRSLEGPYYVETRVYSTKDALATSPDQRYTKALVTLKAQLDPENDEWEDLRRFLKTVKTTLFANSEPVFYADKK